MEGAAAPIRAGLPPDLIHKAVAFATPTEWLGPWRTTCRGVAALSPEWYVQAAPGARVGVVSPGSTLQAVTDDEAFFDRDGAEGAKKHPWLLILLPGDHLGPVRLRWPLCVLGWHGARLRGSRLGGASPQAGSNDCRDAQLVVEEGYSGRLQNLRISGPPGRWAIAATGGEPLINRCTIENGVTVRGGDVRLTCCLLDGSDGDTLLVDECCAGYLRIDKCLIRGARVDGVALDAPAYMDRCVVEGNGRHGVRTYDAMRAQLVQEANCIRGNAQRDAAGRDVFIEELQPLLLWE